MYFNSAMLCFLCLVKRNNVKKKKKCIKCSNRHENIPLLISNKIKPQIKEIFETQWTTQWGQLRTLCGLKVCVWINLRTVLSTQKRQKNKNNKKKNIKVQFGSKKKILLQTKTESIMGKSGYRVGNVTAVWTAEIRSSTAFSVHREWRFTVHMHPHDVLSGSIGSESKVCAAPCWAHGVTSNWSLKEERLLRLPAEVPLFPKPPVCGPRLLLRSDWHTGQRRSSWVPGRGAVSLQERFNGERTAELHLTSDLNSSAGCRYRWVESRVALWCSAHVLRFHFGGQLREELQDSFEVTTHHLGRDLTGVQLPVVSLTVQRLWNHWDLKNKGCLVKFSF